MSRIGEMLLPCDSAGVPHVRLGDLGQRNSGTRITAARMRSLHSPGAPLRIYGGGQTVVDVPEGTIPQADVVRTPSIVVKSRGNIGFDFCDRPFSHKSEMWSYSVSRPDVEIKFVYYFLLTQVNHLQNVARATSVKLPQLSVRDTDALKVPLPPLEIQREIVRILDQFTQLEAELEAELEARRRQFGCYSRTILAQTGYESTSLRVGDLCTVSRGAVISKTYLEEHPGPYSVYSSQTQNGGVFGCIDSYEVEDESITWTTDGANAGSVFYHLGERYSLTNVCGLLRVRDTSQIRAKYLYYELRERAPYAVSIGMGNPKLMAAQMREVRVPVPSVEKQEHAIRQLDALSSLEVDASVGLPAEIAARRKQYEYYRDKLLTFEEKV